MILYELPHTGGVLGRVNLNWAPDVTVPVLPPTIWIWSLATPGFPSFRSASPSKVVGALKVIVPGVAGIPGEPGVPGETVPARISELAVIFGLPCSIEPASNPTVPLTRNRPLPVVVLPPRPSKSPLMSTMVPLLVSVAPAWFWKSPARKADVAAVLVVGRALV